MTHKVILALAVYGGFIIGLAGDTLNLWFGTEVIMGLVYSVFLLDFSKMSGFRERRKDE